MKTIRIQTDDFDLAQEYQLLRQLSSTVGAVVTFTGLVRDFQDDGEGECTLDGAIEGAIESLSLEHYPGMTETLLAEIVEQAHERWSLIGSTVIHRVGKLLPTDQIVFVGVASQHRGDAFEAAQFLMDYLKTKATFWKKVSQDGEHSWVESKDSDAAAASRWDKGLLLGDAEGSLLGDAEGSLSKNAEGSLLGDAEGSLLKDAEGSLSKNAEGSLLSDAEGSDHA